MNETPEAGQVSASQAIAFKNIGDADSFTVLIHGVGAGTSKALLDEVKKGYRASGLDRPVTEIWLSECPSLLAKEGAEAIFIPGQKGGHYILALPWSKRFRLGVFANRCTIALMIVTVVTVMGYLFSQPLEWFGNSWHWLLIYPLMGALATFVNAFLSEQHRIDSLALSILLTTSFLLEMTFTWWAPWLWLLVALLIAALWIMAAYTIIRCIPIARTLNWQFVLVMLIVALVLCGAAMVRTTTYYSQQTATNLTRHIEERVRAMNLSETLPPESQDAAVVPMPAARKKVIKPRQSFEEDISDLTWRFDGDLAPCLILAAICIAVSWVVSWFDFGLDLGLDVLDYQSDKKGTNSLLVGLGNVIRYLNTQAPQAHLTVVGHSLGSVIAAHAVSLGLTSESISGQMTLITLGSPLNYLYRVFPTVVKSPRELEQTVCSKARWINLWRKSDEVGRELNTTPGTVVQYCIGNGHHNNYWQDGAVWKSVIYETFRAGDFRGTAVTPGNPARGLLETYLGLKTIGAIAALFILGLLLWRLPVWFQ